MALARIITELTKYSDDLARDLREKGFEVQTFAPGILSPEVADLELTLRECSSNEVAQLAADRLGHGGMCVFLDSAAMASQVRSIDLFVLKPKVSEQESTILPLTPPEIVASEDEGKESEDKEEDYKENELVFATDESAPALLNSPPEAVLPHDPSPVVEKLGVLESLSYGFQSVVSRYIALASSFRKDRVAQSQSAMAEEELVPHGLIGQAFVDSRESTIADTPETVSVPPAESGAENIEAVSNNEPVLKGDKSANDDLPDLDRTPAVDLPNVLFARNEAPEDIAAQPDTAQEMPVMFQNDLLHTLHSDDLQQVETRDTSGMGGNEDVHDAITRNAIMAQTAQQFAKANSSPGTVRVITIRTVRRDRRLWNAAILAAACAVLALAVISFPQHFPSKLSGIFVHPQQPATAVDPMPDAKVETEMTTKIPSLAPAATLSKPVPSLATSKSTVQNASQKQMLLKPRTRSATGEFVAKDTFVDYRNRPAEQASTAPKTIKRVVVQN